MKKITTILVFTMLMIIPVSSAGVSLNTVERTYPSLSDGSAVILITETNGLPIVTANYPLAMKLSGSGWSEPSQFVETIPDVFSVEPILYPDENSGIIGYDTVGTSYTFTSVNNMAEYKLTIGEQPESKRQCISAYSLSGTFIDFDGNTGITNPPATDIKIVPISEDYENYALYSSWDTNANGIINKIEVVNAVADWFGDTPTITRNNIFLLIKKYFANTPYIYTTPCT